MVMTKGYEDHIKMLRIKQTVVNQVAHLTTYSNKKYGINRFEDLVQECLIRVLAGVSDFKGDAKFESWSYRICLNTLMNCERHNNRQKRVINSKAADYSLSEEDVDDSLYGANTLATEVIDIIEEAYNKQEDSVKEIFSDCVSGMEDTEIARKYNTYPAAIIKITDKFKKEIKEAIYD